MVSASGPKRVALSFALPSLTMVARLSTVFPVPRSCQYSVSVAPLTLAEALDRTHAASWHDRTVTA